MRIHKYDDDELDIDEEYEEEDDCYPPDTLQNLGLKWSDFI